MPEPAADTAVDGRRARRERNRVAVIDAMFALLTEGHFPPSVDDVAERADVSVSSVFRYFESLDDLQQQTIDRYFERFSHLFQLPAPAQDLVGARIATFVDARIRLYEAIAPIARIARTHSGNRTRIAATLDDTRRFLADQARSHFAPDLPHHDRTACDDVVVLIGTLTAFESWDLLHGTHGRSRSGIRRAWVAGLHALLDHHEPAGPAGI